MSESKCACGHGPDTHPKRMTGRVTRRENCFKEGCHCARYTPLPPDTAARQCLRCSNFALEGHRHCRQCMKELAAAGNGPITFYPCAWCGTWEASKGDDLCPKCAEADRESPTTPPETVSVAMCDQCLTPHPKAFCPKKITADKENTLGKKKDDLRDLRADHDLMRDFIHRQNVVLNRRLDTLEDKVADLTGRMGAREDAAHNLVEALDDVNQNLDTTDAEVASFKVLITDFIESFAQTDDKLDTTDECVNVLKDTVAKLADCVENLNRAQESTTSILKTQHHLVQRLKKRLDQQHDEMVMIDQVNKNSLRGRIATAIWEELRTQNNVVNFDRLADAVIREIPELQARCDCQARNWAAADGIPLDWLKLPEWSLLKDDSEDGDDDE